ncbi:hypothetical protein [Candidatus Nitrosocosmicus arcticus]|uniref:Uncharacterized protein n=1 Tax=Candidatus Nitrosocosmicus arcticus TaxID=2035267 RepID=A0A557SV16_9ARCH|nr:hypothetical protein [Candidatus Nitrosocosmicus arcticus]TVP40443.1 hypothetical protein NARC_70020 [Candidatus Nitrosocosmicus arcticus]
MQIIRSIQKSGQIWNIAYNQSNSNLLLIIKMSTTEILAKSFDTPDEVRTFEKGKLEIVNLGNVIIGRATLEPGWSWGKCVKPLVHTDS